MNARRERIAVWLGGVAGAGGAGIAMLVCCTTTGAVVGGGLAAAGGLLRSPWLIGAVVAVLALAVAALVVHRTGHNHAGHDACCPPSMATAADPATRAVSISTATGRSNT